MTITTETEWARYEAAVQAMQAGVHAQLQIAGEHGAGASPKHLRVGVNSAMVQTSALMKVLVAKEILTDLEVATLMADAMEKEVADFEQALTTATGRPVRLTPHMATFEENPPDAAKN